ncbi:MAG: hypothetical protein V1792_07310 [Pseudomonadota bacterium]
MIDQERLNAAMAKYFAERLKELRREHRPKRLSLPFNRSEWWYAHEVTERWGEPYNFTKLLDAILHKDLPIYIAPSKDGEESGGRLFWIDDPEGALGALTNMPAPDFKDSPHPKAQSFAEMLSQIPHHKLMYFLYHRDDVTWIEKQHPDIKGESRAYWLTHSELMERWEMNAYALEDTLCRLEVPVHQMGIGQVVQVTLGQWITLPNVMIRLADVQDFEEKHQIIDNKRLTGRLLDRLRCIDFAWKKYDDAPNVHQHEIIKQIRDETSWGDGHQDDTVKRWIKEVPLDRTAGRPKRKP